MDFHVAGASARVGVIPVTSSSSRSPWPKRNPGAREEWWALCSAFLKHTFASAPFESALSLLQGIMKIFPNGHILLLTQTLLELVLMGTKWNCSRKRNRSVLIPQNGTPKYILSRKTYLNGSSCFKKKREDKNHTVIAVSLTTTTAQSSMFSCFVILQFSVRWGKVRWPLDSRMSSFKFSVVQCVF